MIQGILKEASLILTALTLNICILNTYALSQEPEIEKLKQIFANWKSSDAFQQFWDNRSYTLKQQTVDISLKTADSLVLYKKKQRAKETEGLDNDGLLVYQKQVMDDQDQQVEQFSALLARQKQLGFAIGDELETQNEILDELDAGVDRTGLKLKFASKKLVTIK
ncbi:hypothetical protein INT45_004865 [Circinella minor]|uniref:t-SNARE coiled-coil homology domain-containing protein n=1 Tax=Circinella minor TaxID=1195481 RepID=A0A8H7RWA8_9FUNG|nr:hypothetical protein INT45_004865 [Circinella minor]